MDTITNIKPISIYSQHGPDEVTKVLTISLEENFFTTYAVKSKIEEHLGLPAEHQVIYRNPKKCLLLCHIDHETSEPMNFEIEDKSLSSLFNLFELTENELDLYLTANCKDNKRSSEICKQYGINILEVQIKTPSGNIIAKFQPILSYLTFDSMKCMLEKNHKLSDKQQIFYGTDFHVLDELKYFLVDFKEILIKPCTIYLLMKKMESNNDVANETCKQLQIPQVSPEVVIRTLDGNKDLHRVNLEKLKFKNGCWFSSLQQDIENKLNLPSEEFLLCLEGKIASFSDPRNWKDLYFRGSTVREQIVFNLTFKPTRNAQVEEFCGNYNIPTFKTVKVKFLTSEIEIDIREKPMKSISEVRAYISNNKQIPVSALEIFLNGKIKYNHQCLLDMFVEEYSNPTSLELHVVVKTMKEVLINLNSPYTKRLRLPVDQMTVQGSKTFYNIKEDIASLIGIPICQLSITCSIAPNLSDETFMQDLAHETGYYKIYVKVMKTVTVNYLNKYGDIEVETFRIAHENHTVGALLSFIKRSIFDDRFKDTKLSQKKRNISKKTLLCDLGSEDVIELKRKTKTRRKICGIWCLLSD